MIIQGFIVALILEITFGEENVLNTFVIVNGDKGFWQGLQMAGKKLKLNDVMKSYPPYSEKKSGNGNCRCSGCHSNNDRCSYCSNPVKGPVDPAMNIIFKAVNEKALANITAHVLKELGVGSALLQEITKLVREDSNFTEREKEILPDNFDVVIPQQGAQERVYVTEKTSLRYLTSSAKPCWPKIYLLSDYDEEDDEYPNNYTLINSAKKATTSTSRIDIDNLLESQHEGQDETRFPQPISIFSNEPERNWFYVTPREITEKQITPATPVHLPPTVFEPFAGVSLSLNNVETLYTATATSKSFGDQFWGPSPLRIFDEFGLNIDLEGLDKATTPSVNLIHPVTNSFGSSGQQSQNLSKTFAHLRNQSNLLDAIAPSWTNTTTSIITTLRTLTLNTSNSETTFVPAFPDLCALCSPSDLIQLLINLRFPVTQHLIQSTPIITAASDPFEDY